MHFKVIANEKNSSRLKHLINTDRNYVMKIISFEDHKYYVNLYDDQRRDVAINDVL